jgi:hypothetical protein
MLTACFILTFSFVRSFAPSFFLSHAFTLSCAAGCGGVSIHLTAMMLLLRHAAAARRVLVVHHSVPLQGVLQPALLNWNAEGLPDLR